MLIPTHVRSISPRRGVCETTFANRMRVGWNEAIRDTKQKGLEERGRRRKEKGRERREEEGSQSGKKGRGGGMLGVGETKRNATQLA